MNHTTAEVFGNIAKAMNSFGPRPGWRSARQSQIDVIATDSRSLSDKLAFIQDEVQPYLEGRYGARGALSLHILAVDFTDTLDPKLVDAYCSIRMSQEWIRAKSLQSYQDEQTDHDISELIGVPLRAFCDKLDIAELAQDPDKLAAKRAELAPETTEPFYITQAKSSRKKS